MSTRRLSNRCLKPSWNTCVAPSRCRSSASDRHARRTAVPTRYPHDGPAQCPGPNMKIRKPLMIRRSLALALAAALVPASAGAADLLQTYEMARNGDPQLAIAESNTLYTKEGEVQARAALLPQVTGDASIRRSRTEIEGRSGTRESTSRNYGLNASQTLFNWGQFSSLRAQRSLGAAADQNLAAANDDLMVRTAAAYFDVLVAIESLAAAETNESAGKRQFDYADKRLEVGLAPITDVHEARAQYDQARANTILARNALQDAYQALAEL